MGGLTDMEQKEWESSIHDHYFDLYVTMVGRVDAQDSDWHDFRLGHAMDISSYHTNFVQSHEWHTGDNWYS